jgi:phage shock protein C
MRSFFHINGPFRDRRGLFLGVLKGLGRHLGIAPWILRLIVVALAALTSFWIVLAVYLAAAVFMPTRPDASSTII